MERSVVVVEGIDVAWEQGIVQIELDPDSPFGSDFQIKPAIAFQVGALLMRAARMANGGEDGLSMDGVEFLPGWDKP